MNTKEQKTRPSFRTYPLEGYKLFFEDERWEEIQKIVNNWENPELKNGKTLTGVISNPETGICFIGENFEKSANHQKEFFQKHVFEKILTDEEYDKCAGFTWQIDRDKLEKRRFDTAKKIPESEYGEPVFHGDDFYTSMDDFRDQWECDFDPVEDPIPEYVYGSEEMHTLKPEHLEHMIDKHFENNIGYFEDWEPDVPNIPNYLQEAWNRFCEENSQKYYEIDWGTVVLLDKN